MICLICRQAEVVERLASVELARDEFRLVASRVPARVCPSCGEVYVEEEVAVQLLQSAQKIYETGLLEEGIEYDRL